jgi:TonB-linked SusC/RagA family outer membrane protein
MNIQNDPYDSYNMRAKIDLNLTKWLKFHTNVGYIYTKMWWPGMKNQQTTFYNVAMGGSPVFVPTNPDGSIVHLTNCVNQGAAVLGGMNLMLTYGKTSNQETVNESTIKNSFEITPFKDLTIHLSHAYRFAHTFGQYRYANAPYSSKEGVISWETTSKFRDELIEENESLYKHVFEAYADYTHTWNRAHNFKATAGMQYDTRYKRQNHVGVEGNLSEELNDFNLSTGTTYNVTGGQSKYKTLGVFGRLNYDYNGKYLVEVSGRADGSSRFWSKNRWGYFPSGSLGWRISQENFWDSLRNWWSDAKIRFSVGSLGNQQVSDYLFVQEINTGLTNDDFTFNGTDKLSYAREDAPVSDNLTWETVTTYDWGLDLSFLNNRLNFTGDYYVRNTTDMMMAGASLPSVYGASEPKTNAADMRTNGWEISLAWRDQFQLLGKPFNYAIRGALGDYKTKVTRFDNDTRLISEHYVGETLGEIWGYRVDGLFRTDEEAAAYAEAVDCSLLTRRIDATSTRQGLHAGDMKFLDLDGDGKLTIGENTVDNPGDRVVIGNSLPRYSYTFGGDFSWNGIDFSILFQGIGRRHWYPGTGQANLFWGSYCRPHNTFLSQQFLDQIWSEDNPDGYFPFPRGYEAYTGNGSQDRTLTVANDRYLQNVAYLRLKNLTVGYTIPWLKKYAEQIRIYLSGENLAYWSPLKKHNKYIDPEAAVSGSAYYENSGEVYNFSKVFTIGIDVTF